MSSVQSPCLSYLAFPSKEIILVPNFTTSGPVHVFCSFMIDCQPFYWSIPSTETNQNLKGGKERRNLTPKKGEGIKKYAYLKLYMLHAYLLLL